MTQEGVKICRRGIVSIVSVCRWVNKWKKLMRRVNKMMVSICRQGIVSIVSICRRVNNWKQKKTIVTG